LKRESLDELIYLIFLTGSFVAINFPLCKNEHQERAMGQDTKAATKPSAADKRVLHRVNKAHVTGEQLMRLAEEVHLISEDERDLDGIMIQAISLFHDADLALSAQFRLRAMARIVTAGHLPGWAHTPQPDGSIRIETAIFDAAGQTPLQSDGPTEFKFSRATLLRKAFQLAKPRRDRISRRRGD
jgi:hypothetical protein